MASLANQTISSTYDGLIKTSTDQPVGVSGVQLLEDGVGNTLALSVGRANQGVTVTGTLTATTLTGTVSATSVLADGVTATTQSAGDNSTKVATTAYVDAQVSASDLDFAGDAGTGAVDLDSQTFTVAGTANEIETSASGQTITIGLPSSVTVGTLNATTLSGTLSTAAQPNITSVGTLTGLNVNGGTANILASFTSTDTAARIEFADDTTSGQVSVGAQGSDFVTFTNSVERLRIDASGNVGIGTSSPDTELHMLGNLKISRLAAPTQYTEIESGGGESRIRAINGAASSYQALVFESGNNTTTTERMRIDSSGNVGIGTSSPDALFQVNKNSAGEYARFGAADQRHLRLSAFDTASSNAGHDINASSSNGVLTFSTGNNERLRILSSGGITFNGDTAAANALDDYEEGTFTPEFADAETGGNTASLGGELGKYTKIGNVVTVLAVLANIDTSGLTSVNDIFIRNLPFAADDQFTGGQGSVVLDRFAFNGFVTCWVVNNYLSLRDNASSTSDLPLKVSSVQSSGSDLFATITYFVN